MDCREFIPDVVENNKKLSELKNSQLAFMIINIIYFLVVAIVIQLIEISEIHSGLGKGLLCAKVIFKYLLTLGQGLAIAFAFY